jgi:hypothetical protein
MYCKNFFAAVLIALTISSFSYGSPRRKNYYPSYSTPNSSASEMTYSYTSSSSSGNNDQERCQAEANYMAANNIQGHVWGRIGSFEGVGYDGSSPNTPTCEPRGNMTLTGDASAQGRNGRWYRVRSWR